MIFRSFFVVTSVFVVAFAIAFTLFSSPLPSSASSSPQPHPLPQAKYTSDCGPGWTVVSSPSINSDDSLYAVAAISAADVWAVGYTYTGTFHTLTQHWDGIGWGVVPSPNAGTGGNYLNAVVAVATNDVWAVGYYGDGPYTLVEHWDGRLWSIVPSPNVGTNSTFFSIAAASATDIWAVGFHFDGTVGRTLTEHWNGIDWSIIPSPNEGAQYNQLLSVTDLSANDAWAVGFGSAGELIEHWDGSAWSIVPATGSGFLDSISAVAPNDIWAVGQNTAGSGLTVLIEHWDGIAWSLVLAPHVDYSSALDSLSVISGNDIWAVGHSGYVSGGNPPGGWSHTLTEHWDGSAWTVVTSPNAQNFDNLYGVAAISSADVWAVGDTFYNTHSTLTEHFAPYPCPPTVTPVPPRCPGERFTDVCPGDYFYQHVLDLNDLGVISGYNTAPPCEGPSFIPCFKPEWFATRGQIAKIVSLAAGFHEDVTGQYFEDVAPDHTFYPYVQRMAGRGIISGYPCGGPGEPCGPSSLSYYRPGDTVSRGQLTKMVAVAFGFNEPVGQQLFEDVHPGHTFYEPIQRLAQRSIISGYPCGGPGEPCSPGNLPFFRSAGSVSRGQIAKVVNLARTQPTPTPTGTLPPQSSPTDTSTPQPSGTPQLTATGTPPVPIK